MAVACARMHVLVYDLKTNKKLSVLPEGDTRALALVLDPEREKDELRDRRRLPEGVSRGWGNTELRVVTANTQVKIWTLPHK
jgi:hypothetical protein